MRTARSQMIIVAAALLLSVITLSCGKSVDPMTEAPGPDFTSLFNGTDFTGWNFSGHKQEDTAWSIVNGIMHCAGEPRNPYLLLTEKAYENFEFYAEFRITKDCNSGIFYHVPETGRQSKLGFETQIMDDGGIKPNKNSSGAIYDVVPPLADAIKRPGLWNRYHVIFDWPVCKVWLNDVLVQDTDFSAHPELKYRMRRGPIGLSNHGDEVDYRNLWIRELPDTDTGGDIFNGADLAGWETIGDADWRVENGMIVSTHGEGFLITEREFEKLNLQAYVNSDTLRSREACIYYRFTDTNDPGYRVDLFDFIKAKKYTDQYGDKIPADIIRPMKSGWFLYRIASADRESKTWLNEFVISENRLLGKAPRGKIAFYRGTNDGLIRIKDLKIREGVE